MTKQSESGACQAPDWSACAIAREVFIQLVASKGAEFYRDLPWRNVDDPYAVLVSEVMLQQTQVARVERYWGRWMELFPTVDALAAADTATVLEMWQGLGYNRRALALKRACEVCSAENGGLLPRTVDELVTLPGIGPATAAGVVAFAYDEPSVYIETNVRSVFLHELFPDCDEVPDKQLVPYVVETCPSEGVRAWYYALLDYGAYLKSRIANPSRRSKHYARQGKFEGSRREKRSFLLKQVLAAPDGIGFEELSTRLDEYECDAGRSDVDRELFESLVDELVAEGFFRWEGELLVP
ncbi:MAG: adenine glycosylase [Eggerthellaceae bacterium]|nr:adenine glycosylase [Eggerthellaceae bacterium]